MSRLNYLFLAISFLVSFVSTAQIIVESPNVEAKLYLGKGKNQPLIVGLGGSEGGNAWASDYWEKTRDQFIEKGYAFLAIGYFGCEGTPKLLDKIGIDDVYNAIAEAKKNKQINSEKIAVIGGSRGGDLALLLGSYYEDISTVVGMSASHAVFPGHTLEFTTSCWTFDEKELPFIPVNEEAVPFLLERNLRGTFEAMLKDTVAEQQSVIKVENIHGAVLLLSATEDDHIPAVEMGEKMMARLKNNNFSYPYQLIVLEGSHQEPTKHFDMIFAFLETNFLEVKER